MRTSMVMLALGVLDGALAVHFASPEAQAVVPVEPAAAASPSDTGVIWRSGDTTFSMGSGMIDPAPTDPGARGDSDSSGSVALLGVESGTTVTIDPKADVVDELATSARARQVYVLAKGEVRQLPEVAELDRRAIGSDKPFGVLDGAACVLIPPTVNACGLADDVRRDRRPGAGGPGPFCDLLLRLLAAAEPPVDLPVRPDAWWNRRSTFAALLDYRTCRAIITGNDAFCTVGTYGGKDASICREVHARVRHLRDEPESRVWLFNEVTVELCKAVPGAQPYCDQGPVMAATGDLSKLPDDDYGRFWRALLALDARACPGSGPTAELCAQLVADRLPYARGIAGLAERPELRYRVLAQAAKGDAHACEALVADTRKACVTAVDDPVHYER